MGKKYVKLYNRVFEALHGSDKLVLCFDMDGQELERRLAPIMANWNWMSERGDSSPNNLAHRVVLALFELSAE